MVKLNNTLFLTSMTWLANKYKKILELIGHQYPFRLIDEMYDADIQDTIFTVQVVGKHLILKLNAKEIFSSKPLLNKFSIEDRWIIFNALNIENEFAAYLDAMHQSRGEIISKSRDSKGNWKFTVRLSRDDQTLYMLSAQQIAKNKSLLKNLKAEEIFDVGYFSALDDLTTQEKKLKKMQQLPQFSKKNSS